MDVCSLSRLEQCGQELVSCTLECDGSWAPEGFTTSLFSPPFCLGERCGAVVLQTAELMVLAASSGLPLPICPGLPHLGGFWGTLCSKWGTDFCWVSCCLAHSAASGKSSDPQNLFKINVCQEGPFPSRAARAAMP